MIGVRKTGEKSRVGSIQSKRSALLCDKIVMKSSANPQSVRAMNRNDAMKDFISVIRRIHTDDLIRSFSKVSIEMFNDQQFIREVEVPIIRYGQPKVLVVQLSAWDIPDIAFLSIKNSTDFRNGSRNFLVGHIVDLYREYSNQNSSAEHIANADANGVFRTVLGITAEQFNYQNRQWISEKISRDYYILIAASTFEHRREVDVVAIVDELFGCSVDDYMAILLTVFWLCMKHPDPLSVPEEQYYRKKNTILTKENIERVIGYYSCTYNDLRRHSLGKQLLYSKPFVCTQRTKTTLSVSMFLVAMMVANGLYWLVRDYFLKKSKESGKNDQTFVNEFGSLFEEYIKDLATRYCEHTEWRKLPESSKKGADFVFDFGAVQFIVESKSALLKLDAKQQVPNLRSIDLFFERTIRDSYQQLVSSYEELSRLTSIPIIKVILLYDEFSNTAIIERSMAEVFDADPSCFVMTIRELEILLYIHRNNKEMEKSILEQIISGIQMKDARRNIGGIYSELGIYENPHFSGEMNYFSKLMEHFKGNLI